jgi:hypothetical protein
MTQQKLTEIVHAWWPVVAAIAAIAVAWGSSTMQIAQIAANQERMLAKQDVVTADLRKIGESIAADHVLGQVSRESIAELKGRLERLEARGH